MLWCVCKHQRHQSSCSYLLINWNFNLIGWIIIKSTFWYIIEFAMCRNGCVQIYECDVVVFANQWNWNVFNDIYFSNSVWGYRMKFDNFIHIDINDFIMPFIRLLIQFRRWKVIYKKMSFLAKILFMNFISIDRIFKPKNIDFNWCEWKRRQKQCQLEKIHLIQYCNNQNSNEKFDTFSLYLTSDE